MFIIYIITIILLKIIYIDIMFLPEIKCNLFYLVYLFENLNKTVF